MDTPPLQALFVPNELVSEILFLLSVKNIVRLKCVSKSWNALISDPLFVQKHHNLSLQNPHLMLSWKTITPAVKFVVPFPVHLLLKNPSITVSSNKSHDFEHNCRIVGSCNGLLCLLFNSETETSKPKNWLRFWNPATRTSSKNLGSFRYRTPRRYDNSYGLSCYKFSFGYDASTLTYKVVAFRVRRNNDSWESRVKIFNLGDNCWRNIQSFPIFPLNWLQNRRRLASNCRLNDGVHLSGTINWLAMYKPTTHVVQFVIVSLDLSTESYKKLLPPPGFNEMPCFQPLLRVLMDSLCLSHNPKKTELVLWQMKEYGVQESWTQLFKISYKNLQMQNIDAGFACLYVNSDTVIFANKYCNQPYIYNLKDKTVKRIKVGLNLDWFDQAMVYVESLVSVP
ncbi:putative F-box domain-containing protein [Medicago truncatula]|uniref:F-box protein interaction domain protein n=1 Tax=Medicago truncatula TaxID=3880 RepID=A0A072U0W6_MEDTR|nr:F-box/kelch-repeat protein At3g23880 [Medicago truncatula]KEH23076.1 F-box protein interaction domain protein [Medicago truncatula]RHN46327.1 putative F-box domain-containing protein [Medicago truncatula]